MRFVDKMSKRGSGDSLSKVIGGIFILFILVFVVLTISNYDSSQENAFSNALDESTKSIEIFFDKIFIPLFGTILGINELDGNKLLAVLSFFMLAIIITSVLGFVNLFGERSFLPNLFIGIAMSIIAVRYMPSDIWSSLTSPTVALLPTMLVALPFAFLIILSMKIKNPIMLKVLWLSYFVFMGYLTFFVESGEEMGLAAGAMKWVYGIFFVLAGVMLFFDANVRKYLIKERESVKLGHAVSEAELQERLKIRARIKELIRLKEGATTEETNELNAQINNLKEKLREFTSID